MKKIFDKFKNDYNFGESGNWDLMIIGEGNSISIKRDLDFAVSHGIEKVMFISTGEVYGNKTIHPSHVEFKPHLLNSFALNKFEGELYAEYLHNTQKLKVLILRVFDVFGDDEDYSIPQLICSKDEILVEGSPMMGRDFIHVDDVLEVVKHFLDGKADFNFKTINVCSGKETIIQDLLDVARNNNVLFKGKKNLIEHRRGDITDLTFMGLEPKIDVVGWVKQKCSGK